MRIFPVLLALTAFGLLAGCNKVSYRKTKGGLPFQVFPSGDTQQIVRGNYVKFWITQSVNDSVLFSNFGKMPAYLPVVEERPYDLTEMWRYMHKGDSAVIKASMDTFIKREPQNPDFVSGKFKKGDRITFYVKILDVFANDSLYKLDNEKTMVEYEPQRKQEEAEYRARMVEEMKKMRAKEDEELEKSGSMAEGLRPIEDYLKQKNITAQKAGKGTYVSFRNQGSGELPRDGQFLTVKYTGRMMRNDSTFDSGVFPLQLGSGQVIRGWEEGLQSFRKGSNGTLYIPGFRAYGQNPPPGSGLGPNEILIFDVEVMDITDTMPARHTVDKMQKN